MVRTFIAIDIPITHGISELYRFLELNFKGIEINYTPQSQFHVTLSFLGATNTDQIKNLSADLTNLACDSKPMVLEFNGIGVFRKKRVPQAIWIGIKPNDSLMELQLLINELVVKQGFTSGHKIFSPHITLGRIKKVLPENNLDWIINKNEGKDFGKVVIKEVVFYQSILTANGAIYTVLQNFILQ